MPLNFNCCTGFGAVFWLDCSLSALIPLVADGEAGIPACHHRADELDLAFGKPHSGGPGQNHGSCRLRVGPGLLTEVQGRQKFFSDTKKSSVVMHWCVFSLLQSSLSVTWCLIHIPKGFRIDLTCKQLTVDFVNQSVLQISSQDVEGKRSDKTDFAEKLGAMNRRWQILQGLIAEKVIFQSQIFVCI